MTRPARSEVSAAIAIPEASHAAASQAMIALRGHRTLRRAGRLPADCVVVIPDLRSLNCLAVSISPTRLVFYPADATSARAAPGPEARP